MLAHYVTTVAARSELRTFATSSGIFGPVDVDTPQRRKAPSLPRQPRPNRYLKRITLVS
jgi:hypothetical protein